MPQNNIISFNSKLLLIILIFTWVEAISQGLILSSEKEKLTFPRYNYEQLGFSSDLPASYSLEKFVPPVLKQEGGTCVGFAAYYYTLSTMYNSRFDITEAKEKYVHSFDPYFIYSVYYNDGGDCDRALPFDEAFNKLEKLGAKKLFFPPFTSCDSEWLSSQLRSTLEYTTPYSIKSWYFLDKNNLKKEDLIKLSKKLITAKTPLITGFKFVNSMYPYSSRNLNGVKADGVWKPSKSEMEDGGHALSIIGYDDFKYGGSFRAVNSWGDDFGDHGYLWIKYDDFIEYVELIFVYDLNSNIKNLPPNIIETDSYKRYSYKNNKNSYNSYEGQYKNNGVNGFGIWSDKENDSYYVGKYKDGDMDGFFLVVDQDGIFSANAVNGSFQNMDKIGFSNFNSDYSKTQKDVKDYFLRLGDNISIRKANSSRQNTIKKR